MTSAGVRAGLGHPGAIVVTNLLLYDGICYTRGRTIHLAGDGIACHVDGEYIGQAPLTVSILARSAPILVPTVNILKAGPSLRRSGCDRSEVFSLRSPELAAFIASRGAL